MVSTHHGHFREIPSRGKFSKVMCLSFSYYELHHAFLASQLFSYRDNALLHPTLLARTITRPCPRMKGLGLESGARWTRPSRSVSSIGAAKGSTRWLQSPTQPMESYLNKRYSQLSTLNSQLNSQLSTPNSQLSTRLNSQLSTRKFSNINIHFPPSSINTILAGNHWTWPLSVFIKLQPPRSIQTSKENGCNYGTERTRNGQPTDFL